MGAGPGGHIRGHRRLVTTLLLSGLCLATPLRSNVIRYDGDVNIGE